MKALTVYPEPASEIAKGFKTIEYRSWSTDYRGDLVIHSSNKPEPGFVAGYALCIVEITDVIKYGEKDYGWILENPRMIKPVRVKGQRFIWEYC